jgi:hypothetical protein
MLKNVYNSSQYEILVEFFKLFWKRKTRFSQLCTSSLVVYDAVYIGV